MIGVNTRKISSLCTTSLQDLSISSWHSWLGVEGQTLARCGQNKVEINTPSHPHPSAVALSDAANTLPPGTTFKNLFMPFPCSISQGPSHQQNEANY